MIKFLQISVDVKYMYVCMLPLYEFNLNVDTQMFQFYMSFDLCVNLKHPSILHFSMYIVALIIIHVSILHTFQFM